MSDFGYTLNTTAGAHRVYGTQVGRFAVRLIDGSHPHSHASIDKDLPWRVDHIPTGVVLVGLESGPDAFVIADDVSRFCSFDPASSDLAEAQVQMGASVVAWLRFTIENMGLMVWSFRTWCEKTGKNWR